jgi:hypothetical protein
LYAAGVGDVAATNLAKERKIKKSTVSCKMLKGVLKRANTTVKRGDPTSRAHVLSFSRTNTGRWFKHLEAAGSRTQHRRSAFSTPMRRISTARRIG